MFSKKELEIYKDDIEILSESDNVNFNKIDVFIKPIGKYDIELTILFNVNIENYYSLEHDKIINYKNVNIKYRCNSELNLINLIEFNKNIFNEIFLCDVEFHYNNNYTFEFNENLSNEFENNLQSTFESIFCSIHDL